MTSQRERYIFAESMPLSTFVKSYEMNGWPN